MVQYSVAVLWNRPHRNNSAFDAVWRLCALFVATSLLQQSPVSVHTALLAHASAIVIIRSTSRGIYWSLESAVYNTLLSLNGTRTQLDRIGRSEEEDVLVGGGCWSSTKRVQLSAAGTWQFGSEWDVKKRKQSKRYERVGSEISGSDSSSSSSDQAVLQSAPKFSISVFGVTKAGHKLNLKKIKCWSNSWVGVRRGSNE